MSEDVGRFRYQLQASGDGFAWAFRQIPSHRLYSTPPISGILGAWPPARQMWHVIEYERSLVIPSMRQWLGDAMPVAEEWERSDDEWMETRRKSVDEWLEQFCFVHQQQIVLFDSLTLVDWHEPRQTVWGKKSLAMVLTAMLQHLYEHTDTLLRMTLWWEDVEQQEMARSGK